MSPLARVALLLLCPLVSAADESCANGKCVQDDYTSLMQTRTHIKSDSVRGLGPLGSDDTMSVGNDFSCARSAGFISCWGGNQYGQLGIQSNTDTNTPGSAPIAQANLQVVAGAYHTCIISNVTGNEGKVKCWGRNNKGQLGMENTDDLNQPVGQFVDLGSGVTAKALALGDAHSCAITNTDQVKCWGDGADGKLGLESTVSAGDASNTMGTYLAQVSIGSGKSVKSMSAGKSHTCVQMNNDQVKCWGKNTNGQLGQGQFTTKARGKAMNEMGESLPTVDLGQNSATQSAYSAKAVFAGGDHTCVILNNDKAKCWGRNDAGQLGYGNTASRANIGVAPGQMGGALSSVDLGVQTSDSSAPFVVKTMALGGSHTCAIVADPGQGDRVKCWGNNNKGQLGYGDIRSLGDGEDEMGTFLGTVSLGAGKVAVALSCGNEHTCAVLNTNDVKCWGSNSKGQLGDGSDTGAGHGANQMSDNLGPVTSLTTAAP